MSEQAAETTTQPEVVELPPSGDAAFTSLMDALAPEPDAPEAGAGTGEAGAAAPADGQSAPAAQGADGAGAPAAAPAAGDGGKPAVPGEPGVPADSGAAGADAGAADAGGAAKAADAGDADAAAAADTGGAGDRPAEWTRPSAELIPKFGEISTALETRVEQSFQAVALEEVKAEHKNYFDAINKHPRLLVGTEVPAIGREGTETIRDSEDAKEWQEAVKSLLVAEVQDRVTKSMEENSGYLETVHQSIELFQNNPDLIPGTKDFDVELANKFAAFSKPYEVRDDDKKLHGFSVPVQPMIDQLRTQLVAERAKAPAAPSPAAGAPAAAAASTPAAAAADQPQAGIQSKAGASADDEGMATFWGTLGLPDLKL